MSSIYKHCCLFLRRHSVREMCAQLQVPFRYKHNSQLSIKLHEGEGGTSTSPYDEAIGQDHSAKFREEIFPVAGTSEHSWQRDEI